jgi:hypothetical protein
MNDSVSQKAVCVQYGSKFQPPFPHEIVGIALNSLDQLPFNRFVILLRMAPQAGISGAVRPCRETQHFFGRCTYNTFQSAARKSSHTLRLLLDGALFWHQVKLRFGLKRALCMCSSWPKPSVKRDVPSARLLLLLGLTSISAQTESSRKPRQPLTRLLLIALP